MKCQGILSKNKHRSDEKKGRGGQTVHLLRGMNYSHKLGKLGGVVIELEGESWSFVFGSSIGGGVMLGEKGPWSGEKLWPGS